MKINTISVHVHVEKEDGERGMFTKEFTNHLEAMKWLNDNAQNYEQN